jgi:hypothetical protein
LRAGEVDVVEHLTLLEWGVGGGRLGVLARRGVRGRHALGIFRVQGGDRRLGRRAGAARHRVDQLRHHPVELAGVKLHLGVRLLPLQHRGDRLLQPVHDLLRLGPARLAALHRLLEQVDVPLGDGRGDLRVRRVLRGQLAEDLNALGDLRGVRDRVQLRLANGGDVQPRQRLGVPRLHVEQPLGRVPHQGV